MMPIMYGGGLPHERQVRFCILLCDERQTICPLGSNFHYQPGFAWHEIIFRARLLVHNAWVETDLNGQQTIFL